MAEHSWMILLTVLVSANLVLLGLLVKAMFSWRENVLSLVADLRGEFLRSVDDVYSKKVFETDKLWERIEHHLHDEQGRVVINK